MKKLFMILSLSVLAILFCLSAFAAEQTVYVCDGGSGSGASASSPLGSLSEAIDQIKSTGGSVVICGPYTLSSAFTAPVSAQTVTLTSVADDVDYAQTAGAYFSLGANYFAGGKTVFENMTIVCAKNYTGIFGCGNDLRLGAGLDCRMADGITTYPSVLGGTNKALSGKNASLTFESGKWQRVRGGSSAGANTDYHVKFTVNGGEFYERALLASGGTGAGISHNGNITAKILGGVFRRGLSLTAFVGGSDAYTGDCDLTIGEDAEIYGTVSVSSTGSGVFNGRFYVNVENADALHLCEIVGAEALEGGMLSVYDGGARDLSAAESGELSMQNPLRSNGADPWVFYYDGYFYYTATGSTRIGLLRARNLADLQTAEVNVIYAPASGQAYSKNLWSPEIHHFTDEEAGEGNGGWYCFLGSGGDDDEEGSLASKQRQYVIKCLDGDDLLGRWGNPVTGEVNVPQLMTFTEGDYNVDALCGGSSVLRIGGQTYLTFISEVGRGTADFHQTINIATFENPWTVTGTPVTVCEPTEWFEEGGYGYSEKRQGWYPKVVEGATAVYGVDGSVFIVYAGSGYWTTEYCLGQLTYLGGDPMDAANWQKATSPILYKSDEIVGCGHASFVTDESGQGWACYHGYIGTNGSQPAGSRYAFLEPYFADQNGVVIGSGTGHPAPLATVQTMDASEIPLGDRLIGFATHFEGADRNADGRVNLLDGLHLIRAILDGESEMSIADVVRLLKIVMA